MIDALSNDWVIEIDTCMSDGGMETIYSPVSDYF